MNEEAAQRAAEQILQDESLVADLEPDEAKLLLEWAANEASSEWVRGETPDERVATVRTAVKEIGTLVGNKVTLVADDLEERMAHLLVGDLEPSAPLRLQIEKEVAQITAEKDHLDKQELLRQFTAVASQAWQSKSTHAGRAVPLAPRHAATAQVKAQAETDGDAAKSSSARTTARERPIPRPTPMPRKKSLLARIRGR